MEWDNEIVTRLKRLWAEGHSNAEIGRRLGVSENAVTGKVHRLDLPGRPSLIKRNDGTPKKPQAPGRIKKGAPTLPDLNLGPLPPTEEPPPVIKKAFKNGAGDCCRWPLGEPGSRSFRYCDEPTLPRKPYCEAHAAIAYVRVRDRREDDYAANNTPLAIPG